MTREKEKEIETIAFSHLFCNVGDEDWPENPMDILCDAADSGCSGNEISDCCDENEEMIIWEPFERYSASFILEEIDNLIADMTRLCKDA